MPAYTVGSPSTVTRTGWPRRTSAASRSGTESRSRKGWRRTRVTTGAPAARYSPTEACRSTTAPSIGERITVSVSCWRTSSTSERRWSSTPWRFWTSSSASWYRPSATWSADTAASSSARATYCCSQSFASRSRFSWAWSSSAFAWRTTAVWVASTRSSSPSAGSPSRTRACLRAATDWSRRYW